MKLYKLPLWICLAWLCFMQMGCESKDLAVFKDCDECPEMVSIPAGSFLMGADPFTNLAYEREKPQHSVNIKAFAIGKFEITQEQWYSVMGYNNSSNKGRKLPVENISWDEAQLFVLKLSQKTGKKYRLLSEAEWEYAARSKTVTQYFWGDDVKQANDYAWHSEISNDQAQPVGLKKPNQYGLHDMLGNVWEWTHDCWNENYKGAPVDGSSWAAEVCPSTENSRVMRGGNWEMAAIDLRTSTRQHNPAKKGYPYVGFRVARTP
jgi:formylglycine-generating enzyme required for sulfatase activity